MKNLIIIGNTTNARLAKWYFENDTDYNVVAFSVNKCYISEDKFLDLPVLPFENLEEVYPPQENDAFVAIGYTNMNKVREKMYLETKDKGYLLPNYISPICSFLTKEEIGDNNLILEDNTIQPYVKIGSNNVFWSGNHIGHDTVIHNHITITSHVVVSGYCQIHDNSFLGVNSTLHNEVIVEKESLIAAGAIISKKTEEKGVYLPAKSTLISKKSDEIGF